mgnify:CR=1 FL=1
MNNDLEITCVDCQTKFVFTEAEQQFYQERQFQNPKRCKSCRIAKKNSNNSKKW